MPPAKVRLPGYQISSQFFEGLAAIQSSGNLRKGFVDKAGRIVVAPQFSEAGRFAEGLAPVQVGAGEPWGYIDRSGTFVIEPQFDAALWFSEGLAPVRVADKWGYADRLGALRIAARYDSASGFSEGRARVVVDGLAGYISDLGEWVVPPSYFKAGDFREGLAFVCDRSLCGFVDRGGRTAIGLRFDDAGSFASGLAPVRTGEKWGYVDRAGRVVIAAAYDDATEFAEGTARVGVVKIASYDPKYGGYSGRSLFYGFIDPQGRAVIEPRMLGATPFSDGCTVVRLPSGGLCSDCYHYRLMDRDGEFLPGRFDFARPMADGVAIVAVGEHSYVIDRRGSPLVELDHSIPQDPSFAAQRVARVRYGYLDPNGGTALPHAYIHAQPFSEGLAFVEGPWARKSRLRGFVNRSGALVVEVASTVSQALPFTEGLSLISGTVEGSLRYGFMDRSGAAVIPVRYADAAPFSEGLAAVKLSRDLGANDWGYIDRSGAMVIEPRFKAAGSFSNGLAFVEWVTKERYLLGGVIDRQGRVVVDKPYLPELSRMLFGTPSLEQVRQRREVVFGEGLVPVLDGSFRGWVDAAGRRVVPDAQCAHLGLFAEGRAPVAVQWGSLYEGMWGYVEPSGRLVVEPRFAHAERFSEGLAGVRDAAGRSGYITPSGDWAIQPMWLEEAHPFANGLALVKLNGRWGYLDRQGRFAIPPRYLRAGSFAEGLAVTAVAVPGPSRR
jgi:hypothetical protein